MLGYVFHPSSSENAVTVRTVKCTHSPQVPFEKRPFFCFLFFFTFSLRSTRPAALTGSLHRPIPTGVRSAVPLHWKGRQVRKVEGMTGQGTTYYSGGVCSRCLLFLSSLYVAGRGGAGAVPPLSPAFISSNTPSSSSDPRPPTGPRPRRHEPPPPPAEPLSQPCLRDAPHTPPHTPPQPPPRPRSFIGRGERVEFSRMGNSGGDSDHGFLFTSTLCD